MTNPGGSHQVLHDGTPASCAQQRALCASPASLFFLHERKAYIDWITDQTLHAQEEQTFRVVGSRLETGMLACLLRCGTPQNRPQKLAMEALCCHGHLKSCEPTACRHFYLWNLPSYPTSTNLRTHNMIACLLACLLFSSLPLCLVTCCAVSQCTAHYNYITGATQSRGHCQD